MYIQSTSDKYKPYAKHFLPASVFVFFSFSLSPSGSGRNSNRLSHIIIVRNSHAIEYDSSFEYYEHAHRS